MSLEQARAVVAEFVEHYNTTRLHSAIGYVTPQAKLEGRGEQIWQDHDAKLEAARERQEEKRATQKKLPPTEIRMQLNMKESKDNLSIRRIGNSAGSNPSAARDSKTAGLAISVASEASCGFDTKAKNPSLN